MAHEAGVSDDARSPYRQLLAARCVGGSCGFASRLHGWPGLLTRDLVELASTITPNGNPEGFDLGSSGYQTGVAAWHPHDAFQG